VTQSDKLVATSQIRWAPEGAESRSEMKVFEPGDTVTGLPKEDLDRLLEIGSVMKASDLEKRAAPEGTSELEARYTQAIKDRDDEIVALKAKLAAAEEKQNSPVTPSSPAAQTQAKK
jgi:hypothetical protein